jgi:putative DNA methylase
MELAHLEEKEIELERRRRIEDYLDKGTGAAWLKHRGVAHVVQDALLFFDGERYRLSAWVIMPNHVHALLRPEFGNTLSAILHTWKSYSSNQAKNCWDEKANFGRKTISIAILETQTIINVPSTISSTIQ